jgi:hypothetical protein
VVSLGDVGYVAIFRQIFDHWVWQEKPFSKGQAWIDLLLLANHSDHKKPKGDKIITYRRGDVNRSVLFLADRWGWDRKTVKRFLRVLEADNMIVIKGTTQGTTLTIVNYDFWQRSGSTKGTTDGTAYGTTYGATHGTQTIMNNNDKEGEEGGGYTTPTLPPSLEDIKTECREQGYTSVDAEKFFSYYEGRNWKIGGEVINWRSMLRHWDIKDKNKPQKKKRAALDEEFWEELREKARKEDEERAKRERDAAG